MTGLKHISVIWEQLVCISWRKIKEVWVTDIKDTCPHLVSKIVELWRGRWEILSGRIEGCNCDNTENYVK